MESSRPNTSRSSVLQVPDELEGELKRIKSFWSSQKDIYKLKYPHLLVKKVLNKGAFDFKIKYDLSLYAVRLSRKEKCIFYLDPLNDSLKLSTIEFKTKNPEERAKWFIALTKSIKDNQLSQQGFISNTQSSNNITISTGELLGTQANINSGVYCSAMTLTDITEYLLKEDNELQMTIQKSQSAFAALTAQLTELQAVMKGKIKQKVAQIIESGKEFVEQHEESLIQIRKIKKRLFELTEQLAAKQIEQDPKAFIYRENLQQHQKISIEKAEEYFDADLQQNLAVNNNFDQLILPVPYEESKEMIELDDDGTFYDAVERLQRTSYRQNNTPSQRSQSIAMSENGEVALISGPEYDQNGEPWEREELPWLKDPNQKLSIWAVVKDSIGKGDLSKISVPVYFNDPTSLLQKCAQSLEYNDILDKASVEPDPMRRIALIAIYQISSVTVAEKSLTKPFNPLLGETFEMRTDKFDYLAEQVSHHPPIAAIYTRGKFYTMYTCQKTNVSFNGKMLRILHQYRTYFHFDKFDETYELVQPVPSVHNLVIGTMYVDIGETMFITNQKRPNERCEVRFERRGWFSKEPFKLQGEAFKLDGKNKTVFQQIQGFWNSQVTLTDANSGASEVMWTKNPYPEKVDWMYGMSKFHLQVNYFPKRLHDQVAPTDTRRRPDQRALENGDMQLAAQEKERLENRQRSFRKYYEKIGKHHEPRYFTKWRNPSDDQDYWIYNGQYFEKDRLNQDWSNLPSIFDNDFPDEVKPFIVK